VTEGSLYLFSLPPGIDKLAMGIAIENAFEAADSGRILGSSRSFVSEGAILFEIGAYDRDAAHKTISRVCRKLKCRDFEVSWDSWD